MDESKRFDVAGIVPKLKNVVADVPKSKTTDPLALAMRILALRGLGMDKSIRRLRLLAGCRSCARCSARIRDELCCFGNSKMDINNEGASTAFPVKALKNAVAVKETLFTPNLLSERRLFQLHGLGVERVAANARQVAAKAKAHHH